jgi:pentatricopeptide repeat protein
MATLVATASTSTGLKPTVSSNSVGSLFESKVSAFKAQRQRSNGCRLKLVTVLLYSQDEGRGSGNFRDDGNSYGERYKKPGPPRMKMSPLVPEAPEVEKGKYRQEVENAINALSSLPPRGSIARCMESYRNKISLNDFSLIFREFAQRGDWQRSLRLFKYMQRQQWCKPNEHIYTIMIGILGREGMLDRATELFEEMPSNDVDWNVYSFTALINAYGRNGQVFFYLMLEYAFMYWGFSNLQSQ